MDHIWAIGLIILAASTIQSLTGFGFALIAVSLLPMLMDLQVAVPLIVLISTVGNAVLCWHYRDSVEGAAVIRLVGAALVTIPVGLIGLHYLPEHMALRLLGGIIVAYVVYDGLKLSLPQLQSPRWAYAFGAASGILTGAFNTGGPPVVVYGSCHRWSPEQFKSNMPSVFFMTSLGAIALHSWQGHITPALLQTTLYATPFFAGGLALGLGLSRYIEAAQFRYLVLVLLGIMGIRLLF
ncbi:MAG: sulfite exporter TauE/SafE family protein [Cyanobacteria bacterium J06626_23]